MPQAQRWVDLQRWVEGGLEHALPSTSEAIAAALHEVAGDWSVELIVEVGDPGWRGRVPGNPKLIVSACEGRLVVGALIASERAVYYLVGDQAAVGRGGLHLWRTARRHLAAPVSGGPGSRRRCRPGLLGHGRCGAVHRALGPRVVVRNGGTTGVGGCTVPPASGRRWPFLASVEDGARRRGSARPKPGRDPARQRIEFPCQRTGSTLWPAAPSDLRLCPHHRIINGGRPGLLTQARTPRTAR